MSMKPRFLRSWLLAAAALAFLAGARPSHAQEPFLGEIRLVSFGFPPKGWAFCAGQLLPINQNQALFSLLGTTFGGDGRVTFALPDLRGRVGASFKNATFVLGSRGGEEAHTLTLNELPAHTHLAHADSARGTSDSPLNLLPAQNAAAVPHYKGTANATLGPAAIGMTGGGQPHENRPPFLVMNYIIALQGVFPSQNGPQIAPPEAARTGAEAQSAKQTK